MKDLSTAWIAALNSRQFIIRFFTMVDVVGGPYGFWNDVGDVAIGGVTYRGTGTLLSVGSSAGVSDKSIPGLQMQLSGLSTEVLETFFGEVWHQRATTTSVGLLSPDTRNLIDTPDVYFDGYMDNAKLNIAAGTNSVLTVTCEDSSRRMTRTFPNVRSDADQRERSATDTFFQYVTTASQATIFWGQAVPAGFVGAAIAGNGGVGHAASGHVFPGGSYFNAMTKAYEGQ